MQQNFIGREIWLERFQGYLKQEQGVIWRITGQPGIGKSTLLRQFEFLCEKDKHPNVLLELENFTPAHGQDVLAELLHSARFFDAEKSGKTWKEKAGEGFKTGSDFVLGALELGKDLIPGGGLIVDGAKILVSAGAGAAGNAAQISENAAAAHPEQFLLDALAKVGGKRPVCLVDTYEHVLRHDLKIKSRLSRGFGQTREGQEKEIPLSEWLVKLLEYLQGKGWRIVMTGRSIPRSKVDDNLPRFSRTEILEAAQSHPVLLEYLPMQETSMITVLSILSFEGNPLWLRIAMNLLENLLAEGKNLEQLAQQPDYLHECFEEEDPLDIDGFDGIEYGHCKLSLINTMTRHIAGLEDQAWKIALPRVLDKEGIVLQLFEPEQANAILKNFTIAGVFRVTGQQFTLHEEIRDMLLAYARSKGWLDTKETRKLHSDLADYLSNACIEKIPKDRRKNILDNIKKNFHGMEKLGSEKLYDIKNIPPVERAQLFQDRINNNITSEWMVVSKDLLALDKAFSEYSPLNPLLEACYHLIMSVDNFVININHEELWSLIGTSMSPIIFKWLLSLSISEMDKDTLVFVKELLSIEHKDIESVFGKETARAAQYAALSGQAGIFDTNFWEYRIKENNLAEDYFNFQSMLGEFHSHDAERRIEIIDQFLENYSESTIPKEQEQCAKAMASKITLLTEKIHNYDAALKTCDDLLRRYSDSSRPAIQEQCARGLIFKSTLSRMMQEYDTALACCDKILNMYNQNKETKIYSAALLTKTEIFLETGQWHEGLECCTALLNYDYSNSGEKGIYLTALSAKGAILFNLSNQEEALSCCEEVLQAYQNNNQHDTMEKIAYINALVNKSAILGEQEKWVEMLTCCDDAISLIEDKHDLGVDEFYSLALINKSVALINMENWVEAIYCCDKILNQTCNNKSLIHQRTYSMALLNKGLALSMTESFDKAIFCFDELLFQHSPHKRFLTQRQYQFSLWKKIFLLLVLDKRDEATQYIQQVLEQTDNTKQEYIIMRFVLWLTESHIITPNILNAMHDLRPDHTGEIRLLVNQLAEPRKTQAECFIDLFEQHHDIATLEQCLAECQAEAV